MLKEIHRAKLKECGLKITPQRTAVLEAITTLKNHPTADAVITHIRSNHPDIAVGTIYKTLELFVEKGLVKKVKTEKDIMRYDGILENHHHLYCEETEHIEDYFDHELNEVLEKYFNKKKIPNFVVKDIKLQLIGEFTKEKGKTPNKKKE